MLFDVNIGGIRPALTPDELLGRSAAAARTVSQGARPLGALLGGALGVWFGLRGAIWVGAAGTLLPVVWLLLSPLRRLHTLPTTAVRQPVTL